MCKSAGSGSISVARSPKRPLSWSCVNESAPCLPSLLCGSARHLSFLCQQGPANLRGRTQARFLSCKPRSRPGPQREDAFGDSGHSSNQVQSASGRSRRRCAQPATVGQSRQASGTVPQRQRCAAFRKSTDIPRPASRMRSLSSNWVWVPKLLARRHPARRPHPKRQRTLREILETPAADVC